MKLCETTPPRRNLTGNRFGMLVVLEWTKTKIKGRNIWLCQCDCGNLKKVSQSLLIAGKTKSCGCNHYGHSAKHGMRNSPEYRSWCEMRQRCFNSNNDKYSSYGGRGITVCKEWDNSFQAFYDYIGPKPSKKHTLDRINNDGNYEPGNVRWATQTQQVRNRRNTRRITIKGQTKTLAEWSTISGVSYATLWQRYKSGQRGQSLLYTINATNRAQMNLR